MSIDNNLKIISDYLDNKESKVLSIDKNYKLTSQNKDSVARTTLISIPYSFSSRDSIHVDIEINNLSPATAKRITEFVKESLSALETKKNPDRNKLDNRVIKQLKTIKQSVESSEKGAARTVDAISSSFRRFFGKQKAEDPSPHPVRSPDSAYASSASEQQDDITLSTQRNNHRLAKEHLQDSMTTAFPKAELSFVSPDRKPCPNAAEVLLQQDLDDSIFTWHNTSGVQQDIQRDGKDNTHTVLYGVASQFNGSEATSPYQVPKGQAVSTYKKDPTQGPGAQLQFPDKQVELINNAAFEGFNGLCRVLDEKTLHLMNHGYLIVTSEEEANQVIEQLQRQGEKASYICAGNIPKGDENTEKVYQMLVAAPAFGMYNPDCTATQQQIDEIQFLCALHAYRAQFKQAITLAKESTKPVVFKPTTPGLGVFGNMPENVAKGFYVAAKEFEPQLKEHGVQVQLQVFKGKGLAKDMADLIGLNEL